MLITHNMWKKEFRERKQNDKSIFFVSDIYVCKKNFQKTIRKKLNQTIVKTNYMLKEQSKQKKETKFEKGVLNKPVQTHQKPFNLANMSMPIK